MTGETRAWAVSELVSYRWVEQDAVLVIDGLVGQVMPSRGYRDPMTPLEAMHYAEEFSLMSHQARFGWVDAEGRFYGCAYAAHERLLDAIRIETPDAEMDGWVRLGFGEGYQSRYRLNAEQIRTMRRKGYKPEPHLELIKPASPFVESPAPSR